MGSTGPGSTYDDLPQILNHTIGTKFKVVSGYEGTSTILVAMRQKRSGRRLLGLGVGADHGAAYAQTPRVTTS